MKRFLPIIISLVCWVIFIALSTLNAVLHYKPNFIMILFVYVLFAGAAMGATFICWKIFKPRTEVLEESTGDKELSYLDYSMELIANLAFIILFCCLMQLQFPNYFDVFFERYIQIGSLRINKFYIFPIVTYLIVPLWFNLIFKGLKEKNFDNNYDSSVIMQILIITLASYILMMALPNRWCLELAIIEILTVAAAIRKYIWKKWSKKKINIFMIGYVYFWMFALTSRFNQGIRYTLHLSTYLNTSINYVKMIFNGGLLVGPSSQLLKNPDITQFLVIENNYILGGLCQDGWITFIVIIITLFVFLCSTYRLLGKRGISNDYYVLCKAVWYGLALRVVLGTLYSFGIMIPFNLPFSNNLSLCIDTIGLGLLICNYYSSLHKDKALPNDNKTNE